MGKRIVLTLPTLRGGGAERVFVLIANELARRGHDVTLLVWSREGPNRDLVAPTVRLVDLQMPVRGESFGKIATFRGLARSAAMLRRLRPDAVLSGPEFFNLVTTLALFLAGSRARFFPSFHAAAALRANAIGTRIAPFLSRLVAARATCAVAVSAGIRRDLVARGFAEARTTVIHNPLPPATKRADTPYAWEDALARMGDGPVIVTLGRLVPVKDHRTLLHAFAILAGQRQCRLVVFGDGPLEATLKAQAASLGLNQQVLFAGYVNDPAACYAAADLFVLSSTTEGFGNVLIEAMAAGVPVVSTDAPYGPREILRDGRFGRLVPVGDAAALAQAIAATLVEPVAADTLRQRAADFSIDVTGDRYEALVADGRG